MKKQVAGGRSHGLDNPKSRPTDNATWLPKTTTDGEDYALPSTAAYQRIRNASTTIAPEQGFEYHRDQRRAAIQDLTRRYFIQIRSGCGNGQCFKALCFSCQSRISHGHARRATALTARMQSFVLAADIHSKSRLCPDIARLSYHDVLEKYLTLIRDDEAKGPCKKDHKSLTQCLFDTAAVKLFQGAHMQISGQSHLFNTIGNDQSKEIRNPSNARGGYSTTNATELANSGSQNRSRKKSADASDHEWPSQPNASSPKNSLHFPVVPSDVMSRKQTEATQSEKRFCETHTSEKLLNSRKNCKPLGRYIDGEKCLTCQRMPQLYGHTRVLQYMDCQLVDDMRHLLSLEESQSNPESHLKVLHVNASDSASKRVRHSTTLEFFLRQSVHHCLSNAEVLTKSFRVTSTDTTCLSKELKPNVVNYSRLSNSLSFLRYMTGTLVFDSLWQCLQSLYIPPSELTFINTTRAKLQSQSRSGASHKSEVYEDDFYSQYTRQEISNYDGKPYVSDLDAAHIIYVCIGALSVTSICHGIMNAFGYCKSREFQLDHDRDESRQRLFHQLIKVMAARRCYWNIQRTIIDNQSEEPKNSPLTSILSDYIRRVDNVERIPFHIPISPDPLLGACVRLSTYLDHCLTRELCDNWDGSDTVRRWGLVGGILELITDIPNLQVIGFPIQRFLDPAAATANFINKNSNPNESHLLSFGCLLDEATSVEFFRTFNYNVMFKAFENADFMSVFMNRFVLPSMYRNYLSTRLKVALDRFLTINVRRNHILEDSFNQLWRREKRELLRPLKVIMGSGDGEEGLDQGGVSLEYFRLAVNEALAPSIGMFSIDPISNMAWFQPASLEPLYRYELLGLLFSLAIYNGVTLSINFPMVFYLKLMGANHLTRKSVSNGWFMGPNSFTPEVIQDGWPQLAKGLNALLNWKEGDVKDVFVRTYDFSLEAYGQTVNVPMKEYDHGQEWPGLQLLPGQQDAQRTSPGLSKDSSHSDKCADGSMQSGNCLHSPYVTNANREDYVKDYIYWLTEKSIQKQYEAFAKGFYTCISKQSLSILKPSLFKRLVEGHKDINVEMLRIVASYEDGYHEKHPLIKDFWRIVGDFDEQRRSQLLEFVTASDRIPVNGVQTMPFAIVRNGGDCDRIPSAMTCFGKLLLPEYSSAEKLRDKLQIALENSRGFGSL